MRNRNITGLCILSLAVCAVAQAEILGTSNFLNHTAQITCSSQPESEAPEISWNWENCTTTKPNITAIQQSKDLGYYSVIRLKLERNLCRLNCTVGTKSNATTHSIDLFGYDVAEIFNFNVQVDPRKSMVHKNVITLAPGSFFQAACRLRFPQNTKPYPRYSPEILHNGRADDRAKKLFTWDTMIETPSLGTYDNGTYLCYINDTNGNYYSQSYDLIVKDPEPPKLLRSNFKTDVGNAIFKCDFSGFPQPTVSWYKDEGLISSLDGISFGDNNTIMTMNQTMLEDTANYKCVGINEAGNMTHEFTETRRVKSEASLYIITGVVIALFVVTLSIISWKIRSDIRFRRELRRFEKGNLEMIDPDKLIGDQADLLPYDKIWEFPIESLKLGKQIGMGAYGVVLKAEAENIIIGEAITVVAVKMTKRNVEYGCLKALESELKILIHLGKHLNIVNLLGACTRNLGRRELYVIVEYCRFGNLHDYLVKNRDNFVNQLNKDGNVDFGITESDDADIEASVSNPTTNQSEQPEWRIDYRPENEENIDTELSTKHILSWSFQVSRGMEYLASRKVLHGDLAARNVLLADDGIVKICDFGLAQLTLHNEYKKRNNNSPVPMKWMAIESIRDGILSTESDVWSYGILLWELFSLGHAPYSGVPWDETLYNKLVNGYRMDSPKFAPPKMYEMIKECWDANPRMRPSFADLSQRIGTLIGTSLTTYYIDLNDPYVRMNEMALKNNDYLTMTNLQSPDESYVNTTNPSTETLIDLGYLPMRASSHN